MVTHRKKGTVAGQISSLGRVRNAKNGGSRVEPITRALIIQKEPLDKILARTKTWEVRGSRTAIRGRIALIEGGTGLVVGTCEIIEVLGPISLEDLRRNWRKAGFMAAKLHYQPTFAWVLRNARRLKTPARYLHRRGVVIWVRLTPAVARRIDSAHRRGRL